MSELAARKRAVLGHQICGANGLVEGFWIGRNFIKRGEGCEGPAVFARVDVGIYSRDAALPALLIVQREIVRAVLPLDDVGILTGIESAVRIGQKCRQELLNRLSGMQIFRIVPLRIRL